MTSPLSYIFSNSVLNDIHYEINRFENKQVKYQNKLDNFDFEFRKLALIEKLTECVQSFVGNQYDQLENELHTIGYADIEDFRDRLKERDGYFLDDVRINLTDQNRHDLCLTYSEFVKTKIADTLSDLKENKIYSDENTHSGTFEDLWKIKEKIGNKLGNCIHQSLILREMITHINYSSAKNYGEYTFPNSGKLVQGQWKINSDKIDIYSPLEIPILNNSLKKIYLDFSKYWPNMSNSGQYYSLGRDGQAKLFRRNYRIETRIYLNLSKKISKLVKKPPHLKIRFAELLTHDMPVNFLHSNLKKVVFLSSRINNELIQLLAKNCKQLEILKIKHCDELTMIAGEKSFFPLFGQPPLEFPYLKKLTVEHCIFITHVCIKALALDSFESNYNSHLHSIEIDSLWGVSRVTDYNKYYKSTKLGDANSASNFLVSGGWEKYFNELVVEPPMTTTEAVKKILGPRVFWEGNDSSYAKLQNYLSGPIQRETKEKAKKIHSQSRNKMKQATRETFFQIVEKKYLNGKEKGVFDLSADFLDHLAGHQTGDIPLHTFSLDGEHLNGPAIEQTQSEKISGFYRLFGLLEHTITSFIDKCKEGVRDPEGHSEVNGNIREILAFIIEKYEEMGQPISREMEFIDDLCLSLYLQEFNSLDTPPSDKQFAASLALGEFANVVYKIGLTYGTDKTREILDFRKSSKWNNESFQIHLAALIKNLVEISGNLSWTGEDDKISYYVNHPQRAYNSLKSMIDTEAVPWNTLKEGNPIQLLSKFTFETANGKNGIAVHTCAGSPTEASKLSSIIKGALRAMERKKIRWLDVNLQKSEGAEGRRSKALVDAGRNDVTKTLTVHSDTVDGDVFEKGKNLLSENEYKEFNLKKFADKFKKYILEDIHDYVIGGNGYYLSGDDTLNKVDLTIEAATQLLSLANSNYYHSSTEKKVRLFQYTFQLMKNIGEIIGHTLKSKSEGPVDLMYMEHCKQDIDRGAARNFATTYILQLLSNQKVDINRILEMISPILGRPQCAADRSILLHRLEPLLDFLNCVRIDDLIKVFKTYLQNLGFDGLTITVDLLTSEKDAKAIAKINKEN